MSTPAPERPPLPGADLLWYPRFLLDGRAISLQTVLTGELAWRCNTIRMFGRDIAEPRLSVWIGDPEAHYRYSGRDNAPQPWTPALASVRDLVSAACGAPFNSVLVNLYRDGHDHMGWHADDEPELGPGPTIASLSLGAARRMQFRPRPRGPIAWQTDLPSGSLLVMSGQTQQHYHHRIPKTSRPVGARINLTFRWVDSRTVST